MIPNIEVLGSLAKTLHEDFVQVYYLILPVFFTLAVIFEWFKSGSPDGNFVEIVRRVFICTLILVAFKDIAQAITFISDGVSERIDDMSGLDAFLKMASEKASSYSFSLQSLILAFDDLIIALLSYLSYFLLLIARYLTVAMYYFYWIFLSISAPLLILFGVFKGTSQIPLNLFRSMCEVASWKVVWAILSAMLKALAFGSIYHTDGSYLTIIVLNFVIAVAILCTPLMVRSLVGAGIHATTSNITTALAAGAYMVPKAAMAAKILRSEASDFSKFVKSKRNEPYKPKISRKDLS